jgi:DNA polymerase-1
MIVQDAPSYEEIRNNEFFSGSAGRELNKMLAEVGTSRYQCFVTGLLRDLTPFGNAELLFARSRREVSAQHRPLFNKMALPPIFQGLSLLEKEIELVKPRVIVVTNNAALFALTGKWGVKSWRASHIPYVSPQGHFCYVMPIYAPSYILAVWKDRATTVNDLRKIMSVAAAEILPTPPAYNFFIRPNFPKVVNILRDLLNRCEKAPTKLSVDIETRGGHIACTGIGWSALDAICIPHLRVGEGSHVNYWLEAEEAYIVHMLYKLLTHPNAEVIGQNFLYDAQYFHRWFHFIPNFKRDTMIAQHCLFNSMPKGLDFLSSMWTDHHLYWKDESKNWDPKVGEEQLWIYNCKDCVITFEVDESQQAAISSFTATWPELPAVHDFQQSLFYPVLSTMIRGLNVDDESKTRLAKSLTEAINDREKYLVEVVGHPLNIKSPKQMCDFFYRELAQRAIKSRKTGNVTCDDTALTTIGTREPLLLPLLKVIAELRTLGVFVSTFLEAPLDTDQRMRCSFNIAGTSTYRFSSSENAFGSGMNLQNIPSGDENFPNIRELFLTDQEMEFFDIDLDSADLRIVVEESNCAEMRQMLSEGLKPYVEVAKEYYNDPTITKEHSSYPHFKALCHATNYLGTASGVSARIGLLTVEVERIQKWYYSKFPEIKDWQEQVCSRLLSQRFVQNIFGYRMYFFTRIEGTVFNEAIAAIPQSTVACIINRGYRNIHNRKDSTEVLLQVHDSLAGQFPISNRDRALKNIREDCAITLPYPIPLIVPVGIKTSTKSWGNCR